MTLKTTKIKKIKLKNGKIVHLRHILKEDVDCIWRIFNQVVKEGLYLPTFETVDTMFEKISWYNNLIDEGGICIVAIDPSLEKSKNVVGQCIIEDLEWDAASHVGTLGILIRQKYRNLGLGKHLIKFTLEEAKKIQKKKIILAVLATNENAINLYKKLGFKEVGRYSGQYYMNGKYIDEVLMEIWLEKIQK
ncbi:MAG: GNAT family N-acetyltransferase [Promethearchaeota archaeon]